MGWVLTIQKRPAHPPGGKRQTYSGQIIQRQILPKADITGITGIYRPSARTIERAGPQPAASTNSGRRAPAHPNGYPSPREPGTRLIRRDEPHERNTALLGVLNLLAELRRIRRHLAAMPRARSIRNIIRGGPASSFVRATNTAEGTLRLACANPATNTSHHTSHTNRQANTRYVFLPSTPATHNGQIEQIEPSDSWPTSTVSYTVPV